MARPNQWHLGLILSVALVTGSMGCAGTPAAFSTRYPDNVEDELTLLVQRLDAAPARNTPAIAVGVSESNKLYAYDLLARKVLWEVPARPRYVPQLAGNVAVIQEGQRIIGLDLKSGTQSFQFDAGDMHLVGADGEGAVCVVALTAGQGTMAKSRVALVSNGSRRWTRDLSSSVGVPAVAGNVVLVPWSNQYLSGLEVGNGDEFARLRVRDGVISHALVTAGHTYAGSQHGIAALTHEIIAANFETVPHYIAPDKELPGRPQFLRDAYAAAPLPSPDSAQNRIRLTWQPVVENSTVQLAGDNLYLLFYRFVFALGANDLNLHWVYTHDVDLVGARAQADGIVLGDSRGEVRYLSAQSGNTLWVEKNGPPSVDLELPADQSAVGAQVGEAVVASDLRQQLAAAAQDMDSRLVPVRLLAVDLLAKLEDPEATLDLLKLCEDERTTIGIRKAACNALRQRTNGNEHVLAALARHAVFLDGTSAPPVGALAKAAATQHETRATPLLIAHLNDPNTPTGSLPELVRSLGELKDPSAAAPLSHFLLLYHADAVDEYLTQALESVPATLVKLQGEGAREVLAKVANDSLGIGSVLNAARKALAQLDEQAKATEKSPEAEQLAAQRETEAAATPEPPRAPAHITVDIVKQALLPVHDQLQACIRGAQPEAFQARVILVIEDGQVLMVSVLPEHLQSCIEPLIRPQSFPLTQASQRETVSYTIKRF